MRCPLWYAFALIVLAACSPAEPLPPTASEISVTASIPALTHTPPPAAQSIIPESTTAERPATKVFTSTPAIRLAVVDQSSAVDTDRAGWWSIATLGPVGQTFRPSFAGLDAIELWTEDQSDGECSSMGASLQVNVREAAIDGSVVGSSLPVGLPDCFKGVALFSFPSLVALTPNEVYAIEVIITSQDNWGVVWQQHPDPYGRGEAVVIGAVGDADLWFRVGLRDSTPQTEAYCQDGLWQHVRQSDGNAFIDQSDCLQSVPGSQ